ncbi:unnamed protein product, partial [Phaeothamnion confervicola]
MVAADHAKNIFEERVHPSRCDRGSSGGRRQTTRLAVPGLRRLRVRAAAAALTAVEAVQRWRTRRTPPATALPQPRRPATAAMAAAAVLDRKLALAGTA